MRAGDNMLFCIIVSGSNRARKALTPNKTYASKHSALRAIKRLKEKASESNLHPNAYWILRVKA